MSENGPYVPWSDLRAQSWHSAHVRASWPRVQVDLVELVPGRVGERVRSVVRLGDLAPADVRVELVREDGMGDEASGPWTLWASQSYDNGCYVFEAPAPLDADPAHEWRLRVRPTQPVTVPPVERPVHVAPVRADQPRLLPRLREVSRGGVP
jgi:hypothetical protein